MDCEIEIILFITPFFVEDSPNPCCWPGVISLEVAEETDKALSLGRILHQSTPYIRVSSGNDRTKRLGSSKVLTNEDGVTQGNPSGHDLW